MIKGVVCMINNMPKNVMRFVVASVVETEMWYYGTYGCLDKATEVANEIKGVVLDMQWFKEV